MNLMQSLVSWLYILFLKRKDFFGFFNDDCDAIFYAKEESAITEHLDRIDTNGLESV